MSMISTMNLSGLQEDSGPVQGMRVDAPSLVNDTAQPVHHGRISRTGETRGSNESRADQRVVYWRRAGAWIAVGVYILVGAALVFLASNASAEEGLAVATTGPDTQAATMEESPVPVDKAGLREWFRQPQFNVTDGLDDYAEDFRSGFESSPVELTER